MSATSGAARIHERGYRRYDGPRGGVGGAVRSTVVHTLRYILGLRRRARSKVIPWGIAALSYLPAIGFVALVVLVPTALRGLVQEQLPGPESYLGGIVLLIYLAAALAGPAALCGDRRSGGLALYLASPLDRRTYLAAKATAVAIFLLLVTVVPPLIYVLGTVLAGAGPEGPAAVATDVAQAVGAGVALTALFGSLSMAAASLTDRQTAAGGIVVFYVLVSAAVVSSIVFSLDAPRALLLLDVSQVAFQSVAVLNGADTGGLGPTWLVPVALLGWTAALGGAVVWRYDRLEVTR